MKQPDLFGEPSPGDEPVFGWSGGLGAPPDSPNEADLETLKRLLKIDAL